MFILLILPARNSIICFCIIALAMVVYCTFCLDIINDESRIHVKQFQSSTPRYNTLVATLKINITHGVNAVECLSGPSLANFSILSETIPLKQSCQWVYNGIIDGRG